MRLIRLIEAILPKGFLIRPEQPITCADSEPEPDISVVRGAESDFWHQHPTTAELVIEICVTSHNYDRSKLRAYAAAGVKECWLVLGPEKEIEVHTSPSPAGFRESRKVTDRISPLAFPALKIVLSDLFAPVQS